MKYIQFYEQYIDQYGKLIVFDNTIYQIAINDNNNPSRISLWCDGKNIGNMYLDVTKYKGDRYLKIRSVDIIKKHRGQGMGKMLYKVALEHTDTKGIISYLPERINKGSVPSIYKTLNGVIDDSDYAIIYKEKGD